MGRGQSKPMNDRYGNHLTTSSLGEIVPEPKRLKGKEHKRKVTHTVMVDDKFMKVPLKCSPGSTVYVDDETFNSVSSSVGDQQMIPHQKQTFVEPSYVPLSKGEILRDLGPSTDAYDSLIVTSVDGMLQYKEIYFYCFLLPQEKSCEREFVRKYLDHRSSSRALKNIEKRYSLRFRTGHKFYFKGRRCLLCFIFGRTLTTIKMGLAHLSRGVPELDYALTAVDMAHSELLRYISDHCPKSSVNVMKKWAASEPYLESYIFWYRSLFKLPTNFVAVRNDPYVIYSQEIVESRSMKWKLGYLNSLLTPVIKFRPPKIKTKSMKVPKSSPMPQPLPKGGVLPDGSQRPDEMLDFGASTSEDTGFADGNEMDYMYEYEAEGYESFKTDSESSSSSTPHESVSSSEASSSSSSDESSSYSGEQSSPSFDYQNLPGGAKFRKKLLGNNSDDKGNSTTKISQQQRSSNNSVVRFKIPKLKTTKEKRKVVFKGK